jgi:DNA-binding NtrC family response regulator
MARKVLVVEDDGDLRSLIAATLRTAGFDPMSAVSAEDGMALLDGGSCDLAVLDLRLAGLTGLEALNVMSGKWPALPVIIMTAAEDVTEASVLSRGARAFLRKPFTTDQLVEGVRKALGHGGTAADAPPGAPEATI